MTILDEALARWSKGRLDPGDKTVILAAARNWQTRELAPAFMWCELHGEPAVYAVGRPMHWCSQHEKGTPINCVVDSRLAGDALTDTAEEEK